MKIITPLLIAALAFSIACCKKSKDPEPEPIVEPTPETGTVKLGFVNMVDTLPLVFNQNYLNPKGDTFKVTKFNYYISNIVFTKTDNTIYSEPGSYHLIKHSSSTTTLLTIGNIPKGTYKSVSFMLGVDSAANCSGAQPGDLAPTIASDMFWAWSTGYIMFKLEGSAPKSGNTTKALEYHIGGYGGTYKTQRPFTILLSSNIDVNASAAPKVNFKVNVNEFFKSPTLIDVTTQHSTMSAGTAAKMYADNYADMITFLNIQ
ncbi:MAG: hypothetical protein K0S12_2185 [Bacteroidetes bacterium]|jgi:hypothetical protein|nr:hypothetical protein [Bacteroidota bacterium]